ncbi:hypothetical protein GOODEAATRI_004307, partial [Goodea atripinnis]
AERVRGHAQRYYSVDLDRGPSGFGFSLRGGSEYNMGLYVLGLMEGGPASRSQKIQVSDQLVEINGDSTTGMTHSQAVEMIRRGGHRIHLVLKRGNGYVPDYVELSSLSLCMTNSKLGEPCFYVIGRTENTRLPKPKENWEVKTDETSDMAAEYRGLKRDEEQERLQDRASRVELNDNEENYDAESVTFERPLPGVALVDPKWQRESFSFLTSTWSVDQLGDAESESGDSQSDGSLSAASISGLSVAAGALPGPWLVPGQQSLVNFVCEEHRRGGRRTRQRGRRSAVS